MNAPDARGGAGQDRRTDNGPDKRPESGPGAGPGKSGEPRSRGQASSRLLGAPDRAVVLSCEHASCALPTEAELPADLAERIAAAFAGAEDVLASHEGWDPGARELAADFAAALGVPSLDGAVSRLVVETNRTLGHPKLFSRFTRQLDPAERELLVERYARAHHERVAAAVHAAAGPVVHLSLHTFTPDWNGARRDVDVGVLFDPARPAEAAIAKRWLAALATGLPGLRVRPNAPYAGADDGLTAHLRTRFDDRAYAGLELEVAQDLALGPDALVRAIRCRTPC